MGLPPIFQVDGIFETQQELEIEWRDPRVKLHNLLSFQFQNSLSEAEKDDLWIPTLTFTNTANQERSKRDNNSLVTVARLGSLERSGLDLSAESIRPSGFAIMT